MTYPFSPAPERAAGRTASKATEPMRETMAIMASRRPTSTSYSGKAYLGLDSGSTTIKVVLLDDEENILYRYYSSSKGNPVSLFLKQLKKIRELCGERIEIVSSAVTGYGEELM